jgi:serine/threonine protein kinase
LSYAIQVASGLSFLIENNFLHRDVAARNVLLYSSSVVKICDFGLSKNCTNYRELSYTSCNKKPMPWKWMSPESLSHGVYTEKTDVWSFGVFLWEVYSLGQTPLKGVLDSRSLLNMIEKHAFIPEMGREYAPEDVYGVMIQCWNNDPHRRPTFKQLLESLKDIEEQLFPSLQRISPSLR